MAFWCRINQSKHLKLITYQLKRRYIQVPQLNSSVTESRICAVENPFWGIVKKHTDFCNNVRFFAAPVQPKKEEKDLTGPRINEQITAQFVRLVLEEGHKIVSRQEALDRAWRLKLDLVEVQRKADPPVCKIMDFHREKYKKEVQGKERAKAKSDVTLRKGNFKEVKFAGKIEQKDLKMKADTIKRLMESGYRVKCMAVPVNKKEEGEDLGGYLSRLLPLVEDVSIIESGPHVERKQAYIIIRHVKFGPAKKGVKKPKFVGYSSDVVSKGAETTSGDIPTSALCEEGPAGIGLEDESFTDEADLSIPPPVMQNFTKKVMNSAPETVHTPANFSSSKSSRSQPVHGFARADTPSSSSPEPSLGADNRYNRSEARNQFPPTRPVDNRRPGMRDSVRSEAQLPNQRRQPPLDTNPGVRDSVRSETQIPNQRRQPPLDTNVLPSGERKQVGVDSSVFRNTRPPSNIPKREPSGSGPNIPGNPSSSYGIFSNQKANVPGNPGSAGPGANKNIPGSKPDGSQRPGTGNGGEAKWGIFSR
ncbi:translation initiation factor IF3-1, mitochondrial isoform X2 [Pistacia vera]|uniref:translation initiation factor IF3-1, mitochondrial isoform X2 n=1 Tax=Pistacia vera TaxID=55513 RepID=UPI0012631056|nr:translation initiation factor IF3-1, mitochondrial isoform X2 [Pistacia vera]